MITGENYKMGIITVCGAHVEVSRSQRCASLLLCHLPSIIPSYASLLQHLAIGFFSENVLCFGLER